MLTLVIILIVLLFLMGILCGILIGYITGTNSTADKASGEELIHGVKSKDIYHRNLRRL